MVGGETRRAARVLPARANFDLAGLRVGVVEREGVVDGSHIAAGDVLLGLASAGFHSNGYSLVRKVLLEPRPWTCRPATGGEGTTSRWPTPCCGRTRIYVRSLRKLYAAAC
jgi:phosphoribosylformylglycinamidine cyclo-ligase